jgi:hypothetical protein
VRCGGRFHRIVLTRAGRLSLPDHTKAEVRGQLDYERTRAPACRCVLMLRSWRSFTKGGSRAEGQFLPEALRRAAWGRHRVALARAAAAPRGPDYLDDLAGSPFHERPAFLTRVIAALARRLWGPGVTCRVSDGGPLRRAAQELVLSLSLSTSERPLRLPLPVDWFVSVCRRGLAGDGGYLVLKAEEVPSSGWGPDFVFHRCRPAVEGHYGPLGFVRERVVVARGPDGKFQLGRWEWWD